MNHNQIHTYIYNILEEGIYPPIPTSEYKIPTEYKVETTWGRTKNKITIIASIDYIEQKPTYKIQWIDKDTYQEKEIQSNKSPSNATLLFSLVSYT